jgi:predicted enzyme related to lactoylglutathione lyase
MAAGSIEWLELITPDPQEAESFYTKLLGWSFHDKEGHRIASANGINVGEIGTDDGSSAPPHWLPFIQLSGDLESAIDTIRANGGTHFRTGEIPGQARWAFCADPDGAVFAAIHSLTESEPQSAAWPPPVCTVSWYGVAANDLAATARFYANVFGYDPPDPNEEFSAVNTPILMSGARMHAGVLPASPDLPPQWFPYVVVPDADTVLTKSIELGGRPITPVMAIPQIGRIIGLTDPTGAIFFAHQPEEVT